MSGLFLFLIAICDVATKAIGLVMEATGISMATTEPGIVPGWRPSPQHCTGFAAADNSFIRRLPPDGPPLFSCGSPGTRYNRRWMYSLGPGVAADLVDELAVVVGRVGTFKPAQMLL